MCSRVRLTEPHVSPPPPLPPPRQATVFSAPNYCDQMGNKGAFVRFTGADMVPHFTTFEAAPHPNIKPMAFASNFMWGM